MGSNENRLGNKNEITNMRLFQIIQTAAAVLFGSTLARSSHNLHTDTGDELLAETARLVNNVNVMEHEMINGVSAAKISDQLRMNALATKHILKRLNKEKKTSFKELRTAVKANCIALKREYMLVGSIEVSTKVRTLVGEAFGQCNKAQQRVRQLKGSYLLKNLRVKCEIYEDAIKSEDSAKQCITVHNHMASMYTTVQAITKPLLAEVSSAEKNEKKIDAVFEEVKKKLIHAASLVSQLHSEVQGSCSKLKDSEITQYTQSVLEAVHEVTDADEVESISDEPQEKSRRKKDGVNNIMTIVSVVFSLSLLVFIGIGLALPKQSERIPHMSAGPSSRFDDGSDENLFVGIVKSIWWAMTTATRDTSGYVGEKLADMADNGDWSFQNGWHNVKTGAGYVWEGAVLLGNGLIGVKDHITSWKVWQTEQKFPYTSARSANEASRSAFGSVKGTVINMYDSSVYYVKGIYNLYKKDDNVIEEELHAMYLSDSEDEDVLFSTDHSEGVSGRESVMTEYENEYPLVEENVVIPEQVEDKVEQAFKEQRIEAAFDSAQSALVPLEEVPLEEARTELPPSPPRVRRNQVVTSPKTPKTAAFDAAQSELVQLDEVKPTEPPQSPPRVRRHQTLTSPKTPKTTLAAKLASTAIEAAKEHIEYEEYYEEYTDKEEEDYTYTEVTDDEYQNGQAKSPPPPSPNPTSIE